MNDPRLKDARERMKKAVDVLRAELAGVRTGRASTALLEHIHVEVYGQQMLLNQLASLTVPEPRMIAVQPWDKGTTSAIEKAIHEANLGLNPIKDADMIRVPLPELTEERRRELVKVVHKFGEQAKIAVRNVRRDAIDLVKKQEKNKELSKDVARQMEKSVQEITDQQITDIEKVVAQKESDILAI
ncbi:MAG: ribosome recycling factor [Magnetococcales bacterium]|nr:ribosome recycling factor [Magnetococcales bacterium]MBF0322020.1 ribosome recycling factor [Magnetococcales bacterium]